MIMEKVRLCSKLLNIYIYIYILNSIELWDNCELEG